MDMPLTKPEAILAANWIESHFGEQIIKAVKETPFTPDIVISIALQESAQDWVHLIHDHTPEQILPLIISDPSGDQPNTSRHAFPKNLAEFKSKYPELADMLVAEGNKYRDMKGWTPRPWLYKAYGIFCLDVQIIESDKAFFENKLWYSFDACMERLMGELMTKFHITDDVWSAVKYYNGFGKQADEYVKNVKRFAQWIA